MARDPFADRMATLAPRDAPPKDEKPVVLRQPGFTPVSLVAASSAKAKAARCASLARQIEEWIETDRI